MEAPTYMPPPSLPCTNHCHISSPCATTRAIEISLISFPKPHTVGLACIINKICHVFFIFYNFLPINLIGGQCLAWSCVLNTWSNMGVLGSQSQLVDSHCDAKVWQKELLLCTSHLNWLARGRQSEMDAAMI